MTNRRIGAPRRLHVKRPPPGLEQVRQPGALEVGEPGQEPPLVVEVLRDQLVDQGDPGVGEPIRRERASSTHTVRVT